MAKEKYLIRYKELLDYFAYGRHATLEEMLDDINERLNNKNMPTISQSTLQRDVKEIGNITGIKIYYSKRTKSYSLDENSYKRASLIIEELHVNKLMTYDNSINYIIQNNIQKPKSEYFEYLIEAIEKRQMISFRYFLFANNKYIEYNFYPFYLREYYSEWYLIGKVPEKETVYTLAINRLDRFIINDTIIPINITIPSLNELTKDSFGLFIGEELDRKSVV